MVALLGDFVSTVVNWIRGLDPSLRGIIVTFALAICFFAFAKCINVGKNHTERPVKWVYLGLSIIAFCVALLFCTV
ncbi:MAG: hypothetical protein J6C13_04510 [Clostridia bacterium]|nr:hypothetical protein [Clostridia bacterium]